MPKTDLIFVNETLRYGRPAQPELQEVEGFKNFFSATRAPEPFTRVQLERGINGVAVVGPPGQRRRPAVLIRSSPWKAGTAQTPWHDTFDIDAGRVTYFGDHKAETLGRLGSTDGNKLLEEVWSLHRSDKLDDRMAAPPLIVFRAEPWRDSRGLIRQKGAVEFLGVALMTDLVTVTNTDPDSGAEFPNYRAELQLMALDGRPPAFDWAWVNSRRASKCLTECARLAPSAWQGWIDEASIP